MDETHDAEDAAVVRPGGHSSALGCTCNLVNAIIGAGILGLPFAMARCGVLPGILLLLAVGHMSTQGVIYLMKACVAMQVETYEEVGHKLYGNVMRNFVRLNMLFMNYGAAIAYLRIIGDFAIDCFASWGAPAFLCERGAATALITLAVIVPLSLPRKVSALDRVSYSAVLFTVIFCLAVFARFVDPFPQQTGAGDTVRVFTGSVSSINAIATVAFAFSCQTVAPAVYRELSNPTTDRIVLTARAAFSFSAVVYIGIAVMGYLTFGRCVRDDVVASYHRDDVVLTVTRIIMTASVALTYPMCMFPIRSVVRDVIDPAAPLSDVIHYGLSMSVVVTTFVIAVTMPSLTVVFDFIGAVVSPFIAFILPCAFHLKAATVKYVFLSAREKAECYGILGCGVVFGVLSVWAFFNSLLAIGNVTGCP